MDSGGVRHRADVVVGSVVLEFQHSSISEFDWRERTGFYTNGYDKRVFWVYDRTGRRASEDLALPVSIRRLCNTISGCESLAKREFARNAWQCGTDQPVFLDYGEFVVMCYDFLMDDTRCGWDDCYGHYARRCALLTRKGFVAMINQLGAYPWFIMQDFDMDSHVLSNERWFFENAMSVANACFDEPMSLVEALFHKYVVCRSGDMMKVGVWRLPVIAYADVDARFSDMTQSLFRAWRTDDGYSANDLCECLSKREERRRKRIFSDGFGSPVEYHPVWVDSSMISREFIKFL